MKKLIRLFFFCVLFASMMSCEEVIDLDLGNSKPGIVMEGLITTEPGPYQLKINQSVDFGETNDFPPVVGAVVTVTDQDGNSEVLQEVAEGLYHTVDLQGERGKRYRMDVEYAGELYSATSAIPLTVVPLDSLTYEFVEESLFAKEGYYVTAFLTDPAGEVNYYRMKIFVNRETYYFEIGDNLVRDDNLWYFNDQFFDGKQMDIEFPHTLQVGDKVDLELYQVDRSTYDYYRTLGDLGGIGGVAPANPLSNWSNEALGYFGAVSVEYASLVIEEK